MTNPDLDHPYSDIVTVGDLVFVSGCLPVDENENLVTGTGALDAALGMLARRLGSAGLSLDHVVKLTYFVTDIGDRPAANDQYVRTWAEPRPARTMIGVAGLPRGASVEIDAIARVRK
jgi:enamine deaminase RidA (YjgF/YER057c/UK114 family)